MKRYLKVTLNLKEGKMPCLQTYLYFEDFNLLPSEGEKRQDKK